MTDVSKITPLRNVDGLRENAQRKRALAIERTEQAIQKLLSEGKTINFNIVASTAKVSTAWLYKEPEIKARIEHLRDKKSQKNLHSEAMTNKIETSYQFLQNRVQELQAENDQLRGYLQSGSESHLALVLENETQRQEIERLTEVLNSKISKNADLKPNTYDEQDDQGLLLLKSNTCDGELLESSRYESDITESENFDQKIAKIVTVMAEELASLQKKVNKIDHRLNQNSQVDITQVIKLVKIMKSGN